MARKQGTKNRRDELEEYKTSNVQWSHTSRASPARWSIRCVSEFRAELTAQCICRFLQKHVLFFVFHILHGPVDAFRPANPTNKNINVDNHCCTSNIQHVTCCTDLTFSHCLRDILYYKTF